MNTSTNTQAPTIPQVGMPATVEVGSDCYPAKVTQVLGDGRRVWVLRERRTVAECFTLRRNGLWVELGSATTHGRTLLLGEAIAYQDPHF